MFLEYTKKKLINKSIVEYLQVKNQDIISISGAGGKTSTIKLLAKNLVREHKKVLITTTTKMFKTAKLGIYWSRLWQKDKFMGRRIFARNHIFGRYNFD